jgi:hypothetical protein
MVRSLRLPLAAVATLITSACATIAGGGTSQGVSVSSEPAGASFVVKSSSGLQMASGATPQTIKLPRKNEYQIEFKVPGYNSQSVPLTKGLNGWVWGNLIIGWVPGFIVDFASGSAHKLEPSVVQVTLQRGVAGDEAGKLFGIVKQLDASGRVVGETRVEMVPNR